MYFLKYHANLFSVDFSHLKPLCVPAARIGSIGYVSTEKRTLELLVYSTT